MSSSLRTAFSKFDENRIELAIVIGLTVLAAVPRLVFLETLPDGLHNDEAWTGLDAQRILDGTLASPYTGVAGQPTGPLYLVAVFVALLDHTVLAVRLPMALLGTFTVPVAYLTLRVMFDRPVGLFAALLLALGVWHLHYSRIGFMVISWPLFELLVLLFFFLGIKRGHPAFFALAGLALGAGLYTYGAFLVFLVPFGLVVIWAGVREPGGTRIRYVRMIGLMSLSAMITALPMFLYAADPDHDYFGHQRTLAVSNSSAWEESDLIERVDLLLDRGRDFFARAFWGGAVDGTDGAGVGPLVDHLTLLLMAGGVIMLLLRWRDPASIAVLSMIALLPLATITTQDPAHPVFGLYRRALGLVPFLAVLAAMPLAEGWKRAATLREGWRALSLGTIAAGVLVIALLNLNSYFREFRDDAMARATFASALTKASTYIDNLEGDPYILYYDDGGTFLHETRRYLAPEREGEDRAHMGEYDLVPPPNMDVVYLAVRGYADRIDEVISRYPGGRLYRSVNEDGVPEFTAYHLPNSEQLRGSE
jgi:hypothetical protein